MKTEIPLIVKFIEVYMKRVILSLLVLHTLLLFPLKTLAEVDIKNNYIGYVIENQKYEEVEIALQKELSPVLTQTTPLKNVKHAYLDTTNTNNHCYVRFYPADKNTNIYIVSDKKFNFNDNKLTQAFGKLSFQYSRLNDQDSLKEYKSDFINLVRAGDFDGFFVIPDYIKPLKTTVTKTNNYINIKHKRKTLAPYSEDEKEINLTLLDTKEFLDTTKAIYIISKEYRLKQKENKYVHAFEYKIYNQSQTDIILKSVTGESVASLRDVEATALSDLDKLNLLDTMGTLLAIPTAGASFGMKVPNFLRILKITKEAKRYTKGLPENITINPNSSLRILTLKFKSDPKPLIFLFEKKSEEFRVSL